MSWQLLLVTLFFSLVLGCVCAGACFVAELIGITLLVPLVVKTRRRFFR